MIDFNARSKRAYDKKAHNYDDTHDGKFTKKFKELLIANVRIKDNYSVLDVACGNGTLLAALSKKAAISGHGIDISSEMIKAASAKYSNLEFKTAGCEDIPYPDTKFDVITVCASFHHFPDVSACAKEAERLLKPQGFLYIAEVCLSGFLRALVNPFIKLSRAGDVRFYSAEEIIKTFTDRGFGPVDVIKEGHIQLVKLQKNR
ncbi:MAG: class I SAM-dependent methyltransferase [Oscillospiraceae bacterium]|nr:class I SAM-dependent methyltransferase [Oscillospiraceae bacterium]